MASRALWAVLLFGALAAGCGGGGAGENPGGDSRLDLVASVDGPATAAAGATVTVHYSVRNAGAEYALWMGKLRFGHATTPWDALGYVDDIISLSGLAAGQVSSGTAEIAIPAGLAEGTTRSRCG